MRLVRQSKRIDGIHRNLYTHARTHSMKGSTVWHIKCCAARKSKRTLLTSCAINSIYTNKQSTTIYTATIFTQSDTCLRWFGNYNNVDDGYSTRGERMWNQNGISKNKTRKHKQSESVLGALIDFIWMDWIVLYERYTSSDEQRNKRNNSN